MRNRWLVNVALFAAVVALVAFLLWRPAREAPNAGPPLTDIVPANVATIRLARGQQRPVVLARTDGGWRLTAPVNARANTFNVDALLRLAQAPSRLRVGEARADLKRYGLDPPQATVTFGDAVIAFGGKHPFDPLHYVRYRDTVHLIDSRYFASATYPYSNFIDTRLIAEERKLTALQLPNFRLTLTGGTWHRQPEDAALSGDRINDFISQWQHARALSVTRYSGEPVRARVVLTLTNGEKTEALTLGVLAYRPEFILYRADEGLEYLFPEETGTRMLNVVEAGK